MPAKMSDLIVLLPGIAGSELKKDGQVVWGWSGRALVKNLLTVGGALVDDLWVEQDPPDAQLPGDRVVASRLLPDLHVLPGLWKIDGYSTIAEFIKAEFEVVENDIVQGVLRLQHHRDVLSGLDRDLLGVEGERAGGNLKAARTGGHRAVTVVLPAGAGYRGWRLATGGQETRHDQERQDDRGGPTHSARLIGPAMATK